MFLIIDELEDESLLMVELCGTRLLGGGGAGRLREEASTLIWLDPGNTFKFPLVLLTNDELEVGPLLMLELCGRLGGGWFGKEGSSMLLAWLDPT